MARSKRRRTQSAMQYVYVLQSLKFPDRYYVGSTSNVAERLRKHNAGLSESQSRHSSMYGPWKVVVQIAFEDKAKALAFEKYLKSGSGRAFLKEAFLTRWLAILF